MPGVRLYHPTLRNVMFTVEHPTPYKEPILCNTCKIVHVNKTYHLNIDSTGHCIVSETVLEWLKVVALGGMELMNEVVKPPPIRISQNGLNIDTGIVARYLGDN